MRQRFLASLTPAERAWLSKCWPLWARPSQLPPQGDWRIWLLLAGRGFGKTRAGAEWVRWLAAGDFDRAADCALDSRWAVQTGRRALEIARLLRSGGAPPLPADRAPEKEKTRRNK